jgi:hypothetical protein
LDHRDRIFNDLPFFLHFTFEIAFLLLGATAGFAFFKGVIDIIVMHPLVLFPVFLVHFIPVLRHLSILPLSHPNHHIHHFLHQAHLGLELLLQLF